MAHITPAALWEWNTTSPNDPYPTGYGTTPGPTKSGLSAQDVMDYAGVPLVYRGTPQRAFTSTQILQRLRRQEDLFEQETGILLCPTWVASPPIVDPQANNSAGIITTSPDGKMTLGVDYDLEDSAYDFLFNRSQENGWLAQTLRYKPLRIFDGGATAVKTVSYVYPLLNMYYVIDPSWFVEQRDYGYLRIVPSKNTQMLPLFALQLGVQGFTDNLPGGFNIQYTAGLTRNDYTGRFQFIQELLLAATCASILATLQSTVNMGIQEISTLADGVQVNQKYNPKGAYAPEIAAFKAIQTELTEIAIWNVGGPTITTL